MAERIRLYAGTQEGLFVWKSNNGGWDEVYQGFKEAVIDTMSGCKQYPERVYTGVAGDGVYRTEDGGAHWRRLLEGDIRAVAVDPTDDNVVYAGTEPIHLYRSEDRGDTWEEITGLQDLPEEVKMNWWFPRPPHLGHVRNIFVHPDDPNTIYLCLEHGGIARSFDRGKTWEDVSAGIDYLDIHVLSNLPGSTTRYYVATARGFFMSDDPADGWSRAENGFTRDYFHDFIFLPAAREGDNPTMLIASADKSPGSWDRPEVARGAIFRSTDCAQSWHRVGEGIPEEMKEMVWALVHHPTDTNAVYAGFGQVARGHTYDDADFGEGGLILLTRDRGDSWEKVNLDLPQDRVLWVAAD